MANSVYYCHECAQAVDVLIVTTHSPTHSSTSLRCRRCGGEFVELIASPSPSAASSAAPASALEGALGAAASTVPPSAPTSSTRPASSLSASAALARDGAVLYAESDALHVPPYLVSLEPTAVASTTRAAASTSAAPSPSVAAPPGDPAASSAASSSWGLLSDVAAVIGRASSAVPSMSGVLSALLGVRVNAHGAAPPLRSLSSLPQRVLTADTLPAGHCGVCLVEWAPQDRVTPLSCGHCFHSACLAPWLALHASCPLCRARIDERGNVVR